MSIHLPQRRLIRSGIRSALAHPYHLTTILVPISISIITRPSQHRTEASFNFKPKRSDPQPPSPVKSKPKPKENALPTRGDLASSSIFESQEDGITSSDSSTAPTSHSKYGPVTTLQQMGGPQRDPTTMAAALDPDPHARQRWERKMVIRSIRQRDRANKTALLARTERLSLSKSHMYATSIKKLGPLARQIAGKPIEDAIVQMRFSKKKVAKDVLKHLEHARDEAVVTRGMGLGSENGDGVVGEDGRGLMVEDKKGKKRIVKNKTQIYIDQAWVGRGTFGRAPDYRARGQMYVMRPPHTSITVLLKEEATRIRLAKEREQKRLRKKVWVPLPDRAITAQRQYVMW
ncbi:54S ribosomal protein L22, mitochondrial [Varicellaria rhodocarpa]|nr:54S ribosomal protein L22, mitochondrial [Varicellaria rhodocarpa]